jgi:hypothetical protein
MKAEEIFGILVRALGIWELVSGAEDVALIGGGLGVIFMIAVKGAIGGLLLFNADAIVRAAYRTISTNFDGHPE